MRLAELSGFAFSFEGPNAHGVGACDIKVDHAVQFVSTHLQRPSGSATFMIAPGARMTPTGFFTHLWDVVRSVDASNPRPSSTLNPANGVDVHVCKST